MKQKFGQIQIYTGNGKGKTTASLGLCMRARGRNLRVAIVFFDKGGLDYGERNILKQIGVDFWITGCIRFNAKLKKFRFGVTVEDIKSANNGLVIARQILNNGKYDLVVLDEINSTTSLGMLEIKNVLEVIKDKHPNTELIMTGRNAPLQFKKIANLITEMTLKKHYYYEGIEARKGIEY